MGLASVNGLASVIESVSSEMEGYLKGDHVEGTWREIKKRRKEKIGKRKEIEKRQVRAPVGGGQGPSRGVLFPIGHGPHEDPERLNRNNINGPNLSPLIATSMQIASGDLGDWSDSSTFPKFSFSKNFCEMNPRGRMPHGPLNRSMEKWENYKPQYQAKPHAQQCHVMSENRGSKKSGQWAGTGDSCGHGREVSPLTDRGCQLTLSTIPNFCRGDTWVRSKTRSHGFRGQRADYRTPTSISQVVVPSVAHLGPAFLAGSLMTAIAALEQVCWLSPSSC